MSIIIKIYLSISSHPGYDINCLVLAYVCVIMTSTVAGKIYSLLNIVMNKLEVHLNACRLRRIFFTDVQAFYNEAGSLLSSCRNIMRFYCWRVAIPHGWKIYEETFKGSQYDWTRQFDLQIYELGPTLDRTWTFRRGYISNPLRSGLYLVDHFHMFNASIILLLLSKRSRL